MTETTKAQALAMLKIDIGLTATAYDNRLGQYLETAEAEIEREGITFDESIGDINILVMYAAWLWRKRDSMEGMPRMLRYALNNRLFSQKMRG